MKFVNKQKIKSYSLNIIFIIVLFSATIYLLYLIYPIQQFTITIASIISTIFTGFIVIITNQNIQQSQKEKQVANEKQYTIQAITNVLDFIYLIPSNYMNNASSKLPPLITDKEPLNQAFIKTKKNYIFYQRKLQNTFFM